MKIIGLTGGFGTGKTFVASILRSFGAKVIDADRIAHNVIAKGKPAYKKIKALFGPDVISGSGEIDRKSLGKIVFSNKKRLAELNSIVHPDVIREMKRRVRKSGPKDVVVIDAPLLVEAGLVGTVDKLVVVKCSPRNQMARCKKKFRLNKKEVLMRIRRQVSIGKKIKIADFIIDNDGPRSKTTREVRKVWEAIYGNSRT